MFASPGIPCRGPGYTTATFRDEPVTFISGELDFFQKKAVQFAFPI
jgi:hypothetical protein